MPDPLDTMLKEFASSATGPTPPPPEYLRAVARRRHQRHAWQAAGAFLVLAIAAIPVFLMRPAPATFHPGGPGQQPMADSGSRPEAKPSGLIVMTAFALLRSNSEFDVDNLVLPDLAPLGTSERSAALGMPAMPRGIDRILTN